MVRSTAHREGLKLMFHSWGLCEPAFDFALHSGLKEKKKKWKRQKTAADNSAPETSDLIFWGHLALRAPVLE